MHSILQDMMCENLDEKEGKIRLSAKDAIERIIRFVDADKMIFEHFIGKDLKRAVVEYYKF